MMHKKKCGDGMTVKKRLFWSNILMIAVPVVAAAAVGILCIGFIWFGFVNGFGIKIRNQEEFDAVCELVSEKAEDIIKRNSDFSEFETLLDSNGMAVKICSGTEIIYFYGEQSDCDNILYDAANGLGNGASVIQNGRALHKSVIKTKETVYTLYLSAEYNDIHSYANLKIVAAVAAALIAVTVFLSVLITNRFLTKFVLRRIEEPLDILVSGVHELSDGNLDFRITYHQRDEFWSVCKDFNEMAGRLKESVLKLQQQEQSRKELIAGISHDIRSPLTSIQAYIEGLLDGVAKTPEKQRQYLETVKTKAEDLEHIVSQLFLFSKMELGEYPENPQSIRLDETVADAVKALREEYSDKGLIIDTKLVPFTMTADPIQVDRIVTNILENSLKYKNKEVANAKITLIKTGDGCRLTFSDNGGGVPVESLPHLFEVFYRGDPSRQNPGEGSGLGLAIVANAVKRMNGKITVWNNDVGGLTVQIDFSAEATENEEDTDY